MRDLLLLHGAIGSKNQFDAFTKVLNKDIKVHSINFSGHGGESLPETFSIERFGDDVLNYIEMHNLKPLNIFGYSMGGYVALYLAMFFPEKVHSVFTFATKFLWTPEISSRETKMLDPQIIEAKIPNFALELQRRHHPENWKSILEKTAEMMVGLGQDNIILQRDLKEVTCPVMIGIGDNDKMVTLEETIDVYRQLANSKLLVLSDTPHPFEKIDLHRLGCEINRFFFA